MTRYCPWCGDALPANLRAQWEARVAAAGFTPGAMDFPAAPPGGFPADLASDAWWRGAIGGRLAKPGAIP